MQKMYQTDWQGIRFSDFYRLSSRKLAGAGFYQAFYDEFFKRYSQWDDLAPEWLAVKEHWAEFVLAKREPGTGILSVGCGLGAMEHCIKSRDPQSRLFIHEVAPSAWRWIGNEFPDESKFVGLLPDCLPDDIKFGVVYLAAVDYALDDEALIGLLAAIKPFLLDGRGQCLLISASFQASPTTLAGRGVSLLRRLKAQVDAGLDFAGLRSRQFWGWMRSRDDYREVMRQAGYADIQDGFTGPRQQHYWISGR